MNVDQEIIERIQDGLEDLDRKRLAGAAPGRPGSGEGIKGECSCPTLDNNHGRGVPSEDGLLFWISANCPIHARVINNGE